MKNIPSTHSLRLRRSLLATPGNVAGKVAKALTLPVDVLMLDLEDGVPNDDESKKRARAVIGDALHSHAGAGPREISVRVNGPRTRWFGEDIAFVAGLAIPTVVIPMVYDADDMVHAERALDACGAAGDLGLILLIETAAGLLNLQDIVKASPRTNGLIAGGLDFAAGSHSLSILPIATPEPGREDDDLLYLHHRLLAVARAYGLSAIDAMRPGELSDLEGFRAAARRARWLGFDGVDFFHPGFVGIANEVFSPSAEELAWADRVLEAMSARGSDATASAKLDGRAVLPQHVELAHRLRGMAHDVAQR